MPLRRGASRRCCRGISEQFLSRSNASVRRVSAGTVAQAAPAPGHTGAANPALSPEAFQRGWAEAAPAERTGMTVGGTYVKTGLLLIILALGAAFGWGQVVIVDVRGGQVPLQPSWTWLLVFATLFIGIA